MAVVPGALLHHVYRDAIPPAVRGGSGPVELASRRIHQWRAVPQHATIHQRNQHAHDHLTINGATTQRLCRAAVVRELVTEGGGGPAVANSQRRSLCASFPDQAIPVVLTGRWLRRPPPGSRRLLPFGGQLYSLLVNDGTQVTADSRPGPGSPPAAPLAPGMELASAWRPAGPMWRP